MSVVHMYTVVHTHESTRVYLVHMEHGSFTRLLCMEHAKFLDVWHGLASPCVLIILTSLHETVLTWTSLSELW